MTLGSRQSVVTPAASSLLNKLFPSISGLVTISDNCEPRASSAVGVMTFIQSPSSEGSKASAYAVNKSDLALRGFIPPASSKVSSEPRIAASDKTGGLDNCQPSAVGMGIN